MAITYSFVIPFLNEAPTLRTLIDRMQLLFDDIDGYCDLILVDDGSTDDGVLIVSEMMKDNSAIRLIRLSRNFGHQVAVTAGLDIAEGDAVIIMDADLQDPPEIVHELIAEWKNGFDVVHAQRRQREGETWFKKVTAQLFYRLLQKISEVDIPQNVGDFRLIDKSVLEVVKRMPERDRFLRAIFAWVGFSQTTVQFDRKERLAGETKYPLGKMMRLAINGLFGFSDAPLRLVLWMGVCISSLSIMYGIGIFIVGLLSDQFVSGWASLAVLVSFLGGVNLLVIGLMGIYIGRIHAEVKARPLYIVAEDVTQSSLDDRAREKDARSRL